MHHGVTFNFGFTKVCAPAILETCFSHNIEKWIAATESFLYFYIIVLFPLTTILQLINFEHNNFSLLINAVILLLTCHVLMFLHTFSFSLT